MGACAVCEGTFDDVDLLFGDRGPTCAVCLADGEERDGELQRVWVEVAWPPVVALAAWLALCIPLLGLLLTPVIGAFALFGGLNALQRGIRLGEPVPGADPNLRVYLIVSGVAAVSISLGAIGFGALAVVVFALGSLG